MPKSNRDLRVHLQIIADAHREAMHNNVLTDVEFTVGKGETCRQFSAHKVILAFGSPVFEEMFFGKSPDNRSTVVIQEDDPKAFEVLLEYIYGRRAVDSYVLAWKFYDIAEKYSIPGHRRELRHYVCSNPMTENDFWDLIDNDLLSKSVLFRMEVNNFVSSNTEIIYSERFQRLPKEYRQILCQIEKCSIHEYRLLMSLTKRIYDKYGDETTSSDLFGVLRFINFAYLSTDEFCAFLEHFPNVMDKNDSFQILKFLKKRDAYDLPRWCLGEND